MSLNQRKNNSVKTIFNIIMSRYAFLIIIFFMVILFFFAYKFIIAPVSASINGEIKAMNNDLEIQKNYSLKTLKNIKKYKEDYKQINPADRKKINLMIPDENDADDLFTDIELLVLKNGFILNSLEINNTVKQTRSKKERVSPSKSLVKSDIDDQNLGIIKLKLSISSASYERLQKLLKAFEDNLRILDIDNINFSLDGASIDFDIKTYYFKQNAQSKNESK